MGPGDAKRVSRSSPGSTRKKAAKPQTEVVRDDFINSRHIRYFLAICRHGSLTKAAKACGITQPAMTLAAERMERAVDGTLFQRGQTISLTPLAVDLLPLIKRAKAALDRVSSFVHARSRRG
jgi:DNA-binding transcriptional LysR family regulator